MEVEILPATFMDVENSRAYIDQLYSNDPEKCFQAVSELKFTVIGSIREKGSIIEQGVVARLLQMLKAPDSDVRLKLEITTVLNSLAKGLPDHAAALVQAGLLPVLWEQLELSGGSSSHSGFTQMVLCCLRSVHLQGCAPPPPAWNHKLLTTLIQYGYSPPKNQECVASILASACRTSEQQQQLVDSGGGDLVACMLCSPYTTVQLPALHCLAALCLNNERVSSLIVNASHDGIPIPDLIVSLMARDRSHEMQLAAAACLTYLHRANALAADDPRVLFKTLQCLVRLCRCDCSVWIRVEAATVLSFLTEVDMELQRTAAMTDHLVVLMTEFLKFNATTPTSTSAAASTAAAVGAEIAAAHVQGNPLPLHHHSSSATAQSVSSSTASAQGGKCGGDGAMPYFSPFSSRRYDSPSEYPSLMREAGLKVYASLSANDEDIRKRVIETEGLMATLLASISAGSDSLQLAAVRCLHSLSRSVQTLRTTFQDHMVWKPLLSVLKTSPCEELVSVASSTLCNLLLEFSPSKENILDQGGVEFLCGLTRRPHPGLRLNAVWALMNMAFQAEHRVKASILHNLGTDQVFRLLSDTDVNILMKTLGLLRNLLSTKTHIDQIMQAHGKEIMQAIILILEGEHCPDVKEQALCILANIADGDAAKAAIMSNEDVLKKLMNYMVMPNVKLQIASTFCICNLIWNVEMGAYERQARLREMDVDKILESLLATTDPNLYDKVKIALQQFKPGASNWRGSLGGPDGPQ